MKFRVTPNESGGWLCDVRGRLPSGDNYRRRIVAKVNTEKQAQDFAAKHWQAVIDGIASAPEKRTPKFSDFAERWLREHDTANRHKASTIRTKRILLKAHLSVFDDLRLSQITMSHIARLKATLAEKKRSPKTVNNVLSVLAGLLKAAEKWGVIEEAPAVELVRTERKRMAFLPTDIYDQLVAGAAKLKDKRALVAILLAGDQGLRKGELTALEWRHVDLERRLIAVEVSEVNGIVSGTKGRNWRIVPMTDATHIALTALPHRTGRILKGRTKNAGMERKTLTALVKQAETAAGLPETGKLHILRHTYASHLAIAGASIYHLQAALGHQDHATTQGYAKLNVDSLRPLANAIDSRRAETVKRHLLLEASSVASVQGKMVEAVGIEPSFDDLAQPADNAKKQR